MPERPVVVTMGDPGGVGVELLLLLLERGAKLPPFYLVAPLSYVQSLRDQLTPDVTIYPCAPGKVPSRLGLHVFPLQTSFLHMPGRTDPTYVSAVMESTKIALEHVKSGLARGLVTNPVEKAILIESGKFPWGGMTEYLALACGMEHVTMLLGNGEFNVVPVTRHIPVSQVPEELTTTLLTRTIRHVCAYHPAGPILVTGLNPHASDRGQFGTEERDTIVPVLQNLREQGFSLDGPVAADTAFLPHIRKKYRTIIAMYHDQCLPILKALDFEHAVNCTLGLPFPRTSPDHGPAFSLAMTKKAVPTSLQHAIQWAHEKPHAAL